MLGVVVIKDVPEGTVYAGVPARQIGTFGELIKREWKSGMCRETMDDSLVGVVVPVYKVEKYIEKCINSLSDQSYPNYEIILIDDGSPDSCPQICDAYSRQYENIRVVHKKNGGLSSARNAGAENAKGRWIAFVDSDDFVECDYNSHMWELKNQYSSDFVVCGVTDEDESGNYLGNNENSFCEVLNPKDAFFSIYFGRNTCFQAYSKLIAKDFVEQNPFPDGYYEDFATTYLWIDAAKRIVLGDGSGNYHYIQRDSSILKRKLTKEHLHCFEICDDITAYVGRKYPDFEKYNYLLYQKQVVQMLNKQKLTKKQLGDVFDRYKRMFWRNALRKVFDKNIGAKTRAYTVLLCINPCVYILSIKLMGSVRNLILVFKHWKANVKELDMGMNKNNTVGGIGQTEHYPCSVSIICPVYNVENEIRRCIESVLSQSFTDFELILIDDGSTDLSHAICMEYEEHDPRLRLMRIENGGAANARNVGLELSKGKYVAFIDSDDIVEADWLRVMVGLIGDAELAVVGFYTDITEKATRSSYDSADIRKIDAKQCFHEIFDGDVTTYLWNKLYRRKIIVEHSLTFDLDTYWGEDAQFIARYCEYVCKAVIYTGKLYHYIQRNGSIVNSGYDKRMLGFLHGYREIEAISERFQESDTVSLTICLHCQSLLYRWFWSKQKDPETGIKLKKELISRRPVLRSRPGRYVQRAICLMMSYSITLSCMILALYKRVRASESRL